MWQLGRLQTLHTQSHVSSSQVSDNTFVMSGYILKIKLANISRYDFETPIDIVKQSQIGYV